MGFANWIPYRFYRLCSMQTSKSWPTPEEGWKDSSSANICFVGTGSVSATPEVAPWQNTQCCMAHFVFNHYLFPVYYMISKSPNIYTLIWIVRSFESFNIHLHVHRCTCTTGVHITLLPKTHCPIFWMYALMNVVFVLSWYLWNPIYFLFCLIWNKCLHIQIIFNFLFLFLFLFK